MAMLDSTTSTGAGRPAGAAVRQDRGPGEQERPDTPLTAVAQIV